VLLNGIGDVIDAEGGRLAMGHGSRLRGGHGGDADRSKRVVVNARQPLR
jgi:hypothetical protein